MFGMAVAGVAYALVCGKSKKLWRMVIGCAVALLVIYTVGTVWYAVVLGQGEVSISSALLTCVAPFAFPDVLKLILAVLVATRIHSTARV